MPGAPPTSPNLLIPRFSNNDVADFADGVNSVVDRIDAVAAERGSIVDADIAAGAAIGKSKLALLSLNDADFDPGHVDGTPSTPSLRTLGTGADQAMAGNAPVMSIPEGMPGAPAVAPNVARQPSTTRPTFLTASFWITDSTGALGWDFQLQLSPDNIAWTLVGRDYIYSLSQAVIRIANLHAIVPPGFYYRLEATTNPSGKGVTTGVYEWAM